MPHQLNPPGSTKGHWLFLGAYLVTALIYLLPLPLHWTGYIPGDNGDSYLNFWPFWYFGHLLSHGGSLFYHQYQLYPHGVQLVYMTASPLGGLLMTPITLLISPAAGLNTWLLLHLWLGGWCFYRLGETLGCRTAAAWLGGFAYQWSPFVAVHITGHYTLTQTGYTAAALWALVVFARRIAADRGFKAGLVPLTALAVACWAVAVTDFYLAVMTLYLLLLLLGYIACDPAKRSALARKTFWLGLAGAVCLTLILLTPWIIALAAARQGHDYSAPDPFVVCHNTARWRRLISPPEYHFLWQPLVYKAQDIAVSTFNEWTYLGVVAFFVAGVGLLYVQPRQKTMPWLIGFVVALGLGAGNYYTSQRGWPTTPFSIGKYWPTFFPFSEFRVPGRWQFVLCVIVAGGLALGSDALMNRWTPGRKGAAGFGIVLTLLLGFDLARWPLPICPAAADAAGIPAATDKDRGTVLDVPIAIRSGQGYDLGIVDNLMLVRQMAHGRPLIAGNVARLPKDVFSKILNDRELMAFLELQHQLEGFSPEMLAQTNLYADLARTHMMATDLATSTALHWPEFRERYNITTARIPTDWATSAGLQQIINQTAPGKWHWKQSGPSLIGQLK